MNKSLYSSKRRAHKNNWNVMRQKQLRNLKRLTLLRISCHSLLIKALQNNNNKKNNLTSQKNNYVPSYGHHKNKSKWQHIIKDPRKCDHNKINWTKIPDLASVSSTILLSCWSTSISYAEVLLILLQEGWRAMAHSSDLLRKSIVKNVNAQIQLVRAQIQTILILAS